MAEFPTMPLFTDAYLGDTGHLTTVEHGAYLLILIAMWRNGGVLPGDDKTLARYAKLNLDKWGKVKATIMAFLQRDGAFVTQPKLLKTIQSVRQHSQSQSSRAKSRWLKQKGLAHASASIRHMPIDAIQTKKVSTSLLMRDSTRSEKGQAEEEKATSTPPELAAAPPSEAAPLAPTSALMNTRLVRGMSQ